MDVVYENLVSFGYYLGIITLRVRVLPVLLPQSLLSDSILLSLSPSLSVLFHSPQSKNQTAENFGSTVTPGASSSRREASIILSFLFPWNSSFLES